MTFCFVVLDEGFFLRILYYFILFFNVLPFLKKSKQGYCANVFESDWNNIKNTWKGINY